MESKLVIPTANHAAELAEAIRVLDTHSYAYVTFLAGDGDYVKGVICLAKGLRKVKALFPLVVAVLPDVPSKHRDMLKKQGCLLRDIEPVSPPVGDAEGPYIREYFALNYCKLQLWKFVDYTRMIYLDADIQVFENIDSLFGLPSGSLYAVADCLCQLHGQKCADAIQWPRYLGSEPSLYFNAGMFVFEPSLSTYEKLLSCLEVTPPTPFAEQDSLNYFFRETAKPLNPIYNLLLAMLWRHPEYVDLDKVKVVHFCVAGSKPWRFTGEELYMDRADIKVLIERWWEIYDNKALDFVGNESTG